MVRAHRCPLQHRCPLAQPGKGATRALRSQAGRVLAEADLDEEGEAAAALVRGVVSAVAGKKAPEKSDGSTDIERG